MFRSHLPLARRGLAAAVCALAVPSTAVASPTFQLIDQTVRAQCSAAPTPTSGNFTTPTTVDVRVRGTSPTSVTAGQPFSVTNLSADFTLNPHVMRIQIEGSLGTLRGTVDEFVLQADGAQPARAAADGTPANLPATDVRIASAPRLTASSLGAAGPFTASADTTLRVASFRLTLQGVPHLEPALPGAPAVIPVLTENVVDCTPESDAPALASVTVTPETAPAPEVTSVTRRSISSVRGGAIRITGTGLRAATAVVIGGQTVPFYARSGTELWAFATPRNRGTYPLQVMTTSGISPLTGASMVTYR